MLRARRAAGLAGLPARPGYHTIPIQTHFPKVRARPIGDCRASRDTDRDAESTLRTVTEIGRLQRWLNRSTHRSCSCGPASAGVCGGCAAQLARPASEVRLLLSELRRSMRALRTQLTRRGASSRGREGIWGTEGWRRAQWHWRRSSVPRAIVFPKARPPPLHTPLDLSGPTTSRETLGRSI